MIKAVAGLGLVMALSFVFVIATGCGDDCDNSSISASGQGTSTTVDGVETAEIGRRGEIDVAGAAQGFDDVGGSFEPFAAAGGLEQPTISVAADGATTTATGDADGDADGEESSTTVAADGSTTVTAEDGEPVAAATTVVAGSGGSTTVVAETTTTTAAPTTTTAPPTTQPAAPVGQPADPGSAPGNGDTFYVSASTGNDSNDGRSSSSAWKSLQTGLRRISPGQTLLVMNGEYKELKTPGVAHYSVDRGGSSGNWVKIKAAPGHSPTIVASNGSGLQITKSYVEVSGLTIRGQGFSSSNNVGHGIAIGDIHHIRIVGNRIDGMATSGISVVRSSNFELIGNVVSNNAFWSPLQGSGISVWESKNLGQSAGAGGYHNRIIGNRVFSNENKVNSQFKEFKHKTDGNGIIIDSNNDTGYSGRTLVANNLSYDNGGRGILVWKSNKVDIVYNTAYQNGQTDGILGGATEFAAGRADDVTIANNVGWARSGLPAIIFDSVTNGSSFNNVLVSDSPSGHASSSDIMHSGNPGFRNPTTDSRSADFRPTAGSVLDGAGKNSKGAVSTDLVGTSRNTPDIGAFQSEASSR